MAVAPLLAGASLLLAGCQTMYQPMGATGGYKDTRLSDNSYIVEFQGNGNTPKDTVMGFWLYRCAELTVEKGYAYFSIIPKPRQTGAAPPQAPGLSLASDARDASNDWTEAKGGGGGGGGRSSVPVYVPGGYYTSTHWRGNATILMFKSPNDLGAMYPLRASSVIEALKPLVASQGRSGQLAFEDVLQRALVVSSSAAASAPALPWSGGDAGRVEMRDLDGLLKK